MSTILGKIFLIKKYPYLLTWIIILLTLIHQTARDMKTIVKFTGTVEDLRSMTHDQRVWLLALTDGICTGGHPNYILGRCEYLLEQGRLMTETEKK